MNSLTTKINYKFKNQKLLDRALCHSSFDRKHSNERLEFLGDAVLELCSSERLFLAYPEMDEGELTRKRASMVCEDALSFFARYANIGEYLKIGRSEEVTGGRDKPSMLADAVEAIIGAAYLDGGLEAAQCVVSSVLEYIEKNAVFHADAKSELQMFVQRNGKNNLRYEVFKQEGPPHNTTFYVRVILDEGISAGGVGQSKKQAEQQSAAKLLEILTNEGAATQESKH